MMRLNRVMAVLALLSCLLSLLTCVVVMTTMRGPVSISAAKNRSLHIRKTMIAQDQAVEERQWKRMQDLQDGCKIAPKRSRLRRSDLSHVIVDDTHHLVFCYVPKVACTSWKKVMAALNGYPNQTGSSVHRRDKKVLKYLTDYPPGKTKRILQTYVKFMFVREPFERLLSAFKSKFLEGDQYIVNKYGREIITLFRRNIKPGAQASDADVTFVEFINYVIFVGTHQRRFNEHWRPYHSLCHPCEIKYDFIGHYETMAEDAPYLLKRAGVEHLVTFPSFRRTDTTGELLSYYSQIPRNELLRLQTIYQRDLDLFSYRRFPGPLLRLIHDDTSENRTM